MVDRANSSFSKDGTQLPKFTDINIVCMHRQYVTRPGRDIKNEQPTEQQHKCWNGN